MPGSRVELRDLTGTGDHLEVSVTSPGFAGMPLLEQHRLVMGILAEPLSGELHAVRLRTIAEQSARAVKESRR